MQKAQGVEAMREIVLDTETTGLDPGAGHRIVEIACLELVNRVPTGKVFQTFVNPERDMPIEAFGIHGLSQEFLSTHPKFADIADKFSAFIGDADLVIHNAEFDLKFLNAEFDRLDDVSLSTGRIIDTVAMARRRFPGAPASLDALCRRFEIDNSQRTTHGARLDTELLAEVYLELTGGRQPGLSLGSAKTEVPLAAPPPSSGQRPDRPPRAHGPTADELRHHETFVEGLKNPVWKD